MQYFLSLLLQAYCVYHAYKNKNNYYWYFIIIFLPLLGCIIYLLTQVFNKRDLEAVQNEIISVVNPSKKVNDLYKKLAFADTFQNRINLADALHENGDYESALKEYKQAMTANNYKDLSPVSNIIDAYYKTNDYKNVIAYSEKIAEKPNFKGSRAQFIYALALEKLGDIEKAEQHLKAMDKRYSHYAERFTLVQFLVRYQKNDEAKEISKEMLLEAEHMTKPNLKRYKNLLIEIKNYSDNHFI